MAGAIPRQGRQPRSARLPLRALAGVLLAVAGLTLGWLWFRDSAFAKVERVTVTGSGSSERDQVREALEATAVGMSTLHVDGRALRESVAPFASVAGLRIDADFPHDLRVEVLEHEPVATVQAGSRRIPATAGGLLLDGVRADDLPTVRMKVPALGDRVRDRRTLEALAIAAAVPSELRARTDRLWRGADGMTLGLSAGPDLIFGSAEDAPVKWRAAARVLAERSSAGATYLDLRVPGSVAAGGVGPIAPEAEAAPDVVESEPSTIG